MLKHETLQRTEKCYFIRLSKKMAKFSTPQTFQNFSHLDEPVRYLSEIKTKTLKTK